MNAIRTDAQKMSVGKTTKTRLTTNNNDSIGNEFKSSNLKFQNTKSNKTLQTIDSKISPWFKIIKFPIKWPSWIYDFKLVATHPQTLKFKTKQSVVGRWSLPNGKQSKKKTNRKIWKNQNPNHNTCRHGLPSTAKTNSNFFPNSFLRPDETWWCQKGCQNIMIRNCCRYGWHHRIDTTFGFASLTTLHDTDTRLTKGSTLLDGLQNATHRRPTPLDREHVCSRFYVFNVQGSLWKVDVVLWLKFDSGRATVTSCWERPLSQRP